MAVPAMESGLIIGSLWYHLAICVVHWFDIRPIIRIFFNVISYGKITFALLSMLVYFIFSWNLFVASIASEDSAQMHILEVVVAPASLTK